MTTWRELALAYEVPYGTSYDVRKAGVDGHGRVVVNPRWLLTASSDCVAFATCHEHFHAASGDYGDEDAADRYAGRCLRALGISLDAACAAASKASARPNSAANVAEGWHA